MNIFSWIRSKFFPARVKRVKIYKVKGSVSYRQKAVTTFTSFEVQAESSTQAREKVMQGFKDGLVFLLSAKEKVK